jgi:hypothetical protein
MGALAIIGTSFSGYGSVRVMQEAVRVEQNEEIVAKEKKKRPARKPYTAFDVKLLRRHSKARTPGFSRPLSFGFLRPHPQC